MIHLASLKQTTKNSVTTWSFLDIETICVGDKKFGGTEATTWTGEHYPISVTIPSNLLQEPNLFSNPIARDLVSSFIDALKEIFSTQTEVQMEKNFFQIETAKSILSDQPYQKALTTYSRKRTRC